MDHPLIQAVQLLVSGDREVYLIVLTSLRVSIISTGISAFISIPLAVLLHFGRFPLKRGVVAVLNALMALPTVVIGLFVFSLISRSGPLGRLDLLFTPAGIVIGHVILASPILISMVYTGLTKIDNRFHETLITLGAKKKHILGASLVEARFVIVSAGMRRHSAG